jgi:hypothetical protein
MNRNYIEKVQAKAKEKSTKNPFIKIMSYQNYKAAYV